MTNPPIYRRDFGDKDNRGFNRSAMHSGLKPTKMTHLSYPPMNRRVIKIISITRILALPNEPENNVLSHIAD